MIRVPDEKEIGRCGRSDLIAIIRKLEEERRVLWRAWAIERCLPEEIQETDFEEFR